MKINLFFGKRWISFFQFGYIRLNLSQQTININQRFSTYPADRINILSEFALFSTKFYRNNLLSCVRQSQSQSATTKLVSVNTSAIVIPRTEPIMTSFKLHSSAKINGTIPVTKYKSASTGLTLVLAAVEGPVVNGYFVVATEAHDDDGLPHTLEHLIFLGSEKYPYKGVLDMLANRCLSSGTNAWTDTDHTCYTMTTAGKDGFLELLPIYLDHVLYPTLSDAGFVTEVHHVNGDGDDGGVVYCEMQGRENSGESRSHLQLLRAIYPDSGYSSETGGMLKNLQTSTSNEKVRHFGYFFSLAIWHRRILFDFFFFWFRFVNTMPNFIGRKI